MPIRYGINFPAWFSPEYLPTVPIKPIKPERTVIEKKDVLLKEVYLNGITVENAINLLEQYKTDKNFILNTEDCIAIYKIVETETLLDDKEFDKRCKEYDKKLREYDKFLAEYNMRLKKHPELLLKFNDAKYREEIESYEDQLVEKEIEFSMLESQIRNMKETVKETKIKLEKLNSANQITKNNNWE